MLDEVDTLHVERNTFSGDELLSYIGFSLVMVCTLTSERTANVLVRALVLAMPKLSTEGARVSAGGVEKVPMPVTWEARPSASIAMPWLNEGMRGWACSATRLGGRKRGWPCPASKGAAKYSPGAAVAKYSPGAAVAKYSPARYSPGAAAAKF
jgi:hypothetical protein